LKRNTLAKAGKRRLLPGLDPAKKFSARKRGVSFIADYRLINRWAVVQLTVIFRPRRENIGWIRFFTENPVRKNPERFLKCENFSKKNFSKGGGL